MKCVEALADATPEQVAALADIALRLGIAMVAHEPAKPVVLATAHLRLIKAEPTIEGFCGPFNTLLAFAKDIEHPAMVGVIDEAQRQMLEVMAHVPSAQGLLESARPRGVSGSPIAWAAGALAGYFLFKRL